MSKIVISVRISTDRLAKIDAAADQLKISRSQAINEALRIFPDLISQRTELSYTPPDFSKLNSEGADE